MKRYYPIVKHSARFSLTCATVILCYLLFSFCLAFSLSHGNVIDAIRHMGLAWQRIGSNVFLVFLCLVPVLVFTGFLRKVELIIVRRLVGGRPAPQITIAKEQPQLLTDGDPNSQMMIAREKAIKATAWANEILGKVGNVDRPEKYFNDQ